MFPTQITLRNLRPSTELSVRIRDLCEKLGHLHPRILTCRVAIEQSFIRSRKPVPMPYHVDVLVRLPGRDIAAHPQEDLQLDTAIKKAFVLVRRQLREAMTLEREMAREPRVGRFN
jgi:hypothetical protein